MEPVAEKLKLDHSVWKFMVVVIIVLDEMDCLICCSVELHPYNICVSIIEPGAHTTNFLDSIKTNVTAAWDRLPADTKDKFGLEYLQKGRLKPST